jgi:hypothetical protein
VSGIRLPNTSDRLLCEGRRSRARRLVPGEGPCLTAPSCLLPYMPTRGPAAPVDGLVKSRAFSNVKLAGPHYWPTASP